MHLRRLRRAVLGGAVVGALALGVGPVLAAPAAPGIAINNVTVAEGDTGTVAATFTLTLSRAINSVVTVGYSTSPGTATSGTDYVPVSGTAVFNRNQTKQTIRVYVKGDRVPEPAETFFVKLAGAQGASISDNSGTGTITGTDPSADLVTSLADSPDPVQAGSNLTYTLTTRNAGPNPSVGVRLVDHLPSTVTFVSASGCTYAASSRIVTCTRSTALAAGASFSRTIVVQPTKSGSTSNTASASATTFDPRSANNTDSESTTVNGTPTGPQPGTVSVADVTANEGNSGTTSFTFHATGTCNDPDGQCYLRFYAPARTAAGDTATAGSDYTALTSTEATVGSSFDRTYTVTVNGDTAVEGNESFSVEAALSTGPAESGSATSATGHGTITNDDAAPVSTVTVGDVTANEGNSGTTNFSFQASGTCNDPDGTCYLDATIPPGGTATPDVDYTPPQSTPVAVPTGAFSAGFTILVHGDTSVEPNETFTLHVTLTDEQTATDGDGLLTSDDGTGTITNDDQAAVTSGNTISVEKRVYKTEGNSGQSNATIHVTGTCNDPSGSCTIGYGTSLSGAGPGDGDTANGSDFNPVTGITGAANGPYDVTFDVGVFGDTTKEDTERFSTYVTMYSSVHDAVVAEDSGRVYIQDDDNAVAVSSIERKEGDSGTQLYTFHLTGTCPAGTCYLNASLFTSGTSATPGEDYVAPGPLTDAPVTGTYDRTFIVPVNGDTTPESDEYFEVQASLLSGTSGQGENYGTAYGLGYIDNDDPTDDPRVAVSYGYANEGDSGTSTLDVHLTGHCGGCYLNVYTEGETAEAHSDYIPPSNYSVYVNGDFDELVPITVLGDTDFEADETFRVYGSLTSNEGQGVGYAFANARETIFNDDQAPPTEVSVTNSVSQDEGDSGTTTFTFHVTGTCGDSDAQCYLHFFTFGEQTNQGDTATRDVDYVNVPYNEQPVGPSFSRDFTVTVNGDTTLEPDEVFTVTANLSTSAASNGAQTYGSNTATILNDD